MLRAPPDAAAAGGIARLGTGPRPSLAGWVRGPVRVCVCVCVCVCVLCVVVSVDSSVLRKEAVDPDPPRGRRASSFQPGVWWSGLCVCVCVFVPVFVRACVHVTELYQESPTGRTLVQFQRSA